MSWNKRDEATLVLAGTALGGNYLVFDWAFQPGTTPIFITRSKEAPDHNGLKKGSTYVVRRRLHDPAVIRPATAADIVASRRGQV